MSRLLPVVQRAVIVAGLWFAAAAAEASHFRGASASYTISAAGVVTVECFSVWRSDAVGGAAFQMRTGAGGGGTLLGNFTTTSTINPYSTGTEFGGGGFTVVRQTFTFNLASPARPSGFYYARWTSCCRVAGINNAPESTWAIELKIAYTAGQASAGPTMIPATIDIIGRGFDYSQNLNSADPDGTPVAYQFVTGAVSPDFGPSSSIPGISLSSIGTVSVSAANTASLALGRWVYKVRVTDGSGATAERDVLVAVQDALGNLPPVLGSIGSKTVPVNMPLTFAVSGTDPNAGQNLTVRAQRIPAGASFPQASAVNSVSSTFNWTPATGQEGTYLVNFEVFDNATTILIDNELVQITVTGANNPPVLDPIGNRTVPNGGTLTFTISGSDPDAGQTVSYEAFNLPAGATFDPSTRTFTWTPAAAQNDATFTGITFRIRDNGTPNLVDDETISLTVGAGNQAPVIAPISPQTVVAGQPLQFSVTATDGNAGQTILLTPGSGGLPPGATFPTVSGPSSGPVGSTFDWTPTVAQIGNHTVRFRAEDNGSPILNSELVVSIEVKSLSLDPALNAGLDSFIRSTSVQPDGKIVIGGFFNTVGGVTRNRIARLNADGTLDAGFNPDANSIVLCTAVQADGKIVVGGQFTSVGATTRSRIARINPNGTLDPGFNPDADSLVASVAVQPGGEILIGGFFTTVSGVGRNRIARLLADDTLDASFNPNANGDVNSVVVQADGKILIGGSFSTVGGVGRNRIARLNADGTLDSGFNPNVLGTVLNVTVQADGKILIGGQFTTVGGQARNRLARLHPDGTLDASFNPDVNGAVISTVLQADGQMVIGGTFTTVGGTTRNNIARLRADGTLDPSFNPNANSSVASVALQADGPILAGGNFTSIGGGSRNYFARLLNDAASQTLSVPSAARIEWLRGGSTPEATAVSFELSTDGLNWTALGAGTRISGGWELTGLGLPSNGTIRARARTTGGQCNGSSGLMEQLTVFSGLPVPEIAVELGVGTDLVNGVASIDFGTVNVGDSFSPPSLTVHSLGNAPLNLTAVETSGGDAGDFSIRLLTVPTPLPATLPAAGGAGTFEVVFQPTAGGPRSTTLRILSNDADESPFEISLAGIGNANLSPTGIALDVATVPENQPAATLVGLFTATDPNSGDMHTFVLVPGAGDSGNASFTIDGNALKTTAGFNHEAQNAYSIRVRATDNGGLSFEQALVVSVLDVNESPVIGNALPDSITAQYGNGFFYAPAPNTFTDVDAGQTLTYSATSLPPGIAFDAVTRSFSGVSAQAGAFLITLTATDNGTPNLSAQDSMLFIITPAPLTAQAGDASRAYGDANPAFTGTLTGLKNGDNITASYSTTATPASSVGPYAISSALNDPDGKLVNYTVTMSVGTLTVTPASLLVVAGDVSRAYGEANPAFTGSLTGVVGGDNITAAYNTSATALSPVGTYSITPSLNDPNGKLANYAITSNNGTLNVNPAIASVDANAKSKTYGEVNPPLDAVVTGEVPGGDAIAYTLDTTATQFSDVGNYPITVALGVNPNYTVTSSDRSLTVSPAVASVVANAKTKSYGEVNPPLDAAVTGQVTGGNPINYTLATTATPLSDVGGYPITVTLGANPNYTVTPLDSTLTVNAAVATVAANAKTKVYGEANPTLDAFVTGEVTGGDPVNYVLDTTAAQFSAVGSYPVTVTLGSNPNYLVTSTDSTLTVDTALATVVANAKVKSYGDANPTLDAVVTGQVAGGDAINYTLSTTATPLSNVGGYPIAVNLGANPNYSVTTTDGTLTVNTAILVVTADNQSRTFGAVNPTLTGSVDGSQNGDQFTLSLACSATEDSLVGTYPIVPSLTDPDGKLANYSVSWVDGTLTISPAELQVTIHNPASGYLQTINTPISFTGSFALTGNPGTYSARWMVSSATVPEAEIAATVSGTTASAVIQFATPGVYVVKLLVEDAAGTVGETELVENDLPAYVVIYDPQGGFVTGGGWVNSPAGAFHPNLEDFAGVTGRASFGFVARYLKGANTPTGNTEFQFRAGNLNFKSITYQWLTVAGARAQYKGSGTVNGEEGYSFMLTAVDGALLGSGQPDRFRMKIWGTDTSVVIFDNQAGSDENSELTDVTIIGGGSIVIHKTK